MDSFISARLMEEERSLHSIPLETSTVWKMQLELLIANITIYTHTHTHPHIEFEVLNSCHGDGFGCISYAGNILINLDDDSVTVLPEKSTSIHKQTIEVHNEWCSAADISLWIINYFVRLWNKMVMLSILKVLIGLINVYFLRYHFRLSFLLFIFYHDCFLYQKHTDSSVR